MSNFDYGFESMMGYLFSPDLGGKKDDPLNDPFSRESLEKIAIGSDLIACIDYAKIVFDKFDYMVEQEQSISITDIKNTMIETLEEMREKYEHYGE